MELAVDLGTGPCQSLTVGGGKEDIRGQFLTSQMLPQTPYHTEKTNAVRRLSSGSENPEPQRETIKQRKVYWIKGGVGEERGKESGGLCHPHLLLNSLSYNESTMSKKVVL